MLFSLKVGVSRKQSFLKPFIRAVFGSQQSRGEGQRCPVSPCPPLPSAAPSASPEGAHATAEGPALTSVTSTQGPCLLLRVVGPVGLDKTLDDLSHCPRHPCAPRSLSAPPTQVTFLAAPSLCLFQNLLGAHSMLPFQVGSLRLVTCIEVASTSFRCWCGVIFERKTGPSAN